MRKSLPHQSHIYNNTLHCYGRKMLTSAVRKKNAYISSHTNNSVYFCEEFFFERNNNTLKVLLCLTLDVVCHLQSKIQKRCVHFKIAFLCECNKKIEEKWFSFYFFTFINKWWKEILIKKYCTDAFHSKPNQKNWYFLLLYFSDNIHFSMLGKLILDLLLRPMKMYFENFRT